MQTANLEFRKIPSLYFLYEVNCDGTIIRNVKSKRHLKCFRKIHNSKTEYWCTQINIKHKVRKVFLHNVVAECWLGQKPDGMQTDHIDRNSLNNHYTKFQDKLMQNLALGGCITVKPVRLKKDEEIFDFPSMRKAAKFLATQYEGIKEKSFYDKLYHKRKKIFDYEIEYLNAETRHDNSNE